MTLTNARFSWLMTAVVAGGVTSTLAISVGAISKDLTLTVLGAIGEVATITITMLILMLCVRGSK